MRYASLPVHSFCPQPGPSREPPAPEGDGDPGTPAADLGRRPLFSPRGLFFAALCFAWSGSVLGLLFIKLLPIDPQALPRFPRLELIATWLDSLRVYGALALLGVAALYLVTRRWRFCLVSLLVAWWMAMPFWSPIPDLEASTSRMPPKDVRVVSVNLSRGTGHYAPLERWCLDHQAQIVLLIEATPDFLDAHRSQLLVHWPHRAEAPRRDGFGMAVYSRLPLEGVRWRRVESVETPQLRCVVKHVRGDFVLHGVHLLPPRRRHYLLHRAEFIALRKALAREEKRVLLMGDFNFVGYGPLAKRLEQDGYRRLGGDVGTWPADRFGAGFPRIRIDHVFIGSGFGHGQGWVGPHIGSDHLPIYAVCDFASADDPRDD